MLLDKSEDDDTQSFVESKRTMPKFIYEDMLVKSARKMLRKFRMAEESISEPASISANSFQGNFVHHSINHLVALHLASLRDLRSILSSRCLYPIRPNRHEGGSRLLPSGRGCCTYVHGAAKRRQTI